MIKRLRWLIGARANKTLTNSTSHHSFSASAVSPSSGTLHEVAVYLHRFHNLDLFQQGWYQIKVSMRLEDNEFESIGTPARVVQYEAATHIQGFEGAYGVWRIDDVENSFLTQPFMIKYAKQDVYLSIMVSFVLSLLAIEGPTSAVILKFELMCSPTLESGPELLASLNACPAAVHEFRIPPKALLGLHSYCPVHFDSNHAVLIDTSVHITMLKASSTPTIKDTSQVDLVDSKQVMIIKELMAARDILVHDLRKIGKAIDQSIDLNNFVHNLDDAKFGFILRSNSGGEEEVPQISDRLQNGVKKANRGTAGLQNDGLLHSLSWDELVNSINLLGDQILHLWNTFLMFHRANKLRILEFLHDAWADDRRAEWSIWMVYSKVERPLNYVNSRVDGSLVGGIHGKTPSLWKFSDDPIHTATMRADLHRQSIAQMRINNRSLQDMHIFEDPLRIPIIIVEHVLDAPLHAQNGNSFMKDPKDMMTANPATKLESERISTGSSLKRNARVLKIVVFVHGFQGHHLDLRLVRNQWLLIDPKIEVLMSEANEDKTDGDLREMGLRLAEEVVAFTKKKMDKASRTGNLRNINLNFVGHSIGNIIIRTALTEGIMEPYLRYLHTYVSLSGPHLGYMYSSNSLFNSGLWLLKKFKGTQCIHQLTFSDDPDLTNTFLYKLCKHKTLEHFKNLILVSSPQDGYVPYHSARIEMCSASLLDYTKRGKVFWEMLNACLSQMQAPSTENRVFMRCDVNFDISSQGRNLNTLIGRAAHVEFLESDIFARFIMRSFPELFR